MSRALWFCLAGAVMVIAGAGVYFAGGSSWWIVLEYVGIATLILAYFAHRNAL